MMCFLHHLVISTGNQQYFRGGVAKSMQCVKLHIVGIGAAFQLVERLSHTLQQARHDLLQHSLDADKAGHGHHVGDLRMERRNVHSGETAPAVTHDRDRPVLQRRLPLEGRDAVVQIFQTLGKTVGTFAAGGHAARVIVGINKEASLCQMLNFPQVGPMSVAHTVVEHHQPAGNRRFITIEPAFQIMTHLGLEIIGVGLQARKISRGEVKNTVGVIVPNKQITAVLLFHKIHTATPPFFLHYRSRFHICQ